jgi:hypothetical protein
VQPKQRNFWSLFAVQAKPQSAPLSEADIKMLDEKDAALKQAKLDRQSLVESILGKWCIQPRERTGAFGRKSKDENFDDSLRMCVTQTITDGATAAVFAGGKPARGRPAKWSRGDPVVISADAVQPPQILQPPQNDLLAPAAQGAVQQPEAKAAG